MQNVLFITTHFAPDRHVGAKRVTKFAKYLPQYGWQPVVVTKEVNESHGVDETLLQDLPPEVSIHRVPEWHIFPPSASSNPVDSHVQGAKAGKLRFRRLLIRMLDFLLFYDYSWLLPAFFLARRLIKENNVKLIYSSNPNPEAHLLALLLRLIMPVKWICEYRDPWTTLPACYKPISLLQRPIERWLEGRVLEKADALIFVGRGYRDLILLGRPKHLFSKSHILYNGYDEQDFSGLDDLPRRDGSKLTISHFGTVGKWISPMPFLWALGAAIRQQENLRERIQVQFVGEVKYDPEMAKAIPIAVQNEGLENVVRMNSFLPHRDALREMCRSDVLLLFRNRPDDFPELALSVVPAKFFEYLRARRPILALVPPEGDAARLINECEAGIVVDPDDIEGIAQAIGDLYMAFRRGELKVENDLTRIKQFDRRAQTGRLTDLFAKVSCIV